MVVQQSPRVLGAYSMIAMDRKRDREDDLGSEYSMDMVNDPRFTTPNVLDKRLFAFTTQVGFVGGLTSSASLSQCFKLKKHLALGYCNNVPTYKVIQSSVQLISFFGMSLVLCLSLYSTLVSVNQAYFGNRLMTAGSNGFELAKSFYMNHKMVQMRHRAVKFLARALILLLLSAGGMLYVKFSEDQDVEAGYELDSDQTQIATTTTTLQPGFVSYEGSRMHNSICESHVHPAGVATLFLFAFMACYLYFYIQMPAENLFKEVYSLRYQHENSLGPLLVTSAEHHCHSRDTNHHPPPQKNLLQVNGAAETDIEDRWDRPRQLMPPLISARIQECTCM